MVLKYQLLLKGDIRPRKCGRRRVGRAGAVKRLLCAAALLTSWLVAPADAQKAAAPSGHGLCRAQINHQDSGFHRARLGD
jgi:hypothetical protein